MLEELEHLLALEETRELTEEENKRLDEIAETLKIQYPNLYSARFSAYQAENTAKK